MTSMWWWNHFTLVPHICVAELCHQWLRKCLSHVPIVWTNDDFSIIPPHGTAKLSTQPVFHWRNCLQIIVCIFATILYMEWWFNNSRLHTVKIIYQSQNQNIAVLQWIFHAVYNKIIIIICIHSCISRTTCYKTKSSIFSASSHRFYINQHVCSLGDHSSNNILPNFESWVIHVFDK